MKLSTELVIWLKATEAPREIDTPTAPATEAARLVAPATVEITERSLAVKVIFLASIPDAPSPVMDASTSTLMRLITVTPDPLAAIPAPAPPAIAAEPANTIEPIVCLAVAI